MVQAKHSMNRGVLDPKYFGPAKIVKKIGNTIYLKERNNKKEKYFVLQLKPTRLVSFLPRIMTTLLWLILLFPSNVPTFSPVV